MEKVGDAYVEVLIEGDRKGLDRLRRLLKREASRSGKGFSDEFDRAFVEAEKKAGVSMAERMKSIDRVNWDKLGQKVGDEYGAAAAERTISRMKKDMMKGRIPLPRYEEGKKLDLTKWYESFYSSAIDHAERFYDEEQRLRAKADRDLLRSVRERESAVISAGKREGAAYQQMLNEAYRLNDKFDRDRASGARAAEKEIEGSLKRLEAVYSRTINGQVSQGKKLRDVIVSTREHIDELNKSIESTPNFGGRDRDVIIKTIRDMDDGLVRIAPGLRRFNGSLDELAPRIGRTFGKGSRSDIVNLFGSVIQFGFQAATTIPKVVEGFMGMARTFMSLKSAGQGVFSSLAGALRGGAGGAAAFASSLTAAAVAIPVVLVLVGALVSTLSMLLGIVTALASSLTFALGGGLVAVAGLLLPVAAGVGVLAGAIASLSDEQKKAIKTAIQPFTEGMKDIGRSAADAIFGGDRFTKTIKDMTAGLASSNMKNLVTDIANAIGDVGAGWAESLNSDGFRNWLTAMGETVPGQIRNLGATARNVLGGLGGFFLAAQPFISDFTQWLERISGAFMSWANSASGRQQIVEFLEKAKESAKAVGGFLLEVVQLIAQVFDAGKGTGDSFFDDMADAVERFSKYIEGGGLAKWFEDTKNFAEDMGSAISTAAGIINDIDRNFRAFANSPAFGILKAAFDAAKWAATEMLDHTLETLGMVFKFVGELIQGLGDFGGLLGKLPGVPDSFGESWRNAGQDMIDAGAQMRGFNETATITAQGVSASSQVMGSSLDGVKGKSVSLFDSLKNGTATPYTAKIGETGVAPTVTKTLGLFDSLKKVDAPFLARVGENGAGGATGSTRTFYDSLKRVDGPFTAKIREDGVSRVNSSISGLWRSLRDLTSKMWTVSVGGKVMGGGNKSARGSIIGGYGTMATASKMAGGGGMLNYRQTYRGVETGEAGKEAIVPLQRPLGQVDPLVRELSAFAQGKLGKEGKSIDMSGWTIVSPQADPEAVAEEIANIVFGGLL